MSMRAPAKFASRPQTMQVRPKLARHRGAPLSDQEMQRQASIRGELEIDWWKWEGPPKLTARLMAVRTADYKDLVPPLSDVQITFADRNRLILRGIETLNTARGAVGHGGALDAYRRGAELAAPTALRAVTKS